jgi:putative lipoprotein
VSGTELTATFGDDGTVRGSTGCNELRGPYKIDGERIALGPFASSRRACLLPEAGTQEQAFLTALAASARFEIVGDRLTLRDGNGATQVVMIRASGSAAVTGTVTYRERIALPANAVVQVSLQNASRADTTATVLGEQSIDMAGRQVPIPFEIAYDPANIDLRMTYTVRARITVDGQLLFTSTTSIQVITHGRPSEVEIVVERVG